MATAYTDIYKRFVEKVSDYNLLEFNLDTREDILRSYLKSSEVDFQRICKTDLSDKDEKLQTYNQELTNKEIEILALGMLVHWYNPIIHNTDLLRNFLNTKDYTMYSNANLLMELNKSKKQVQEDLKRMIMDYSYENANILGLND